jgi:uncharacterized SAM-binding protein YcdF (DUF218 family)
MTGAPADRGAGRWLPALGRSARLEYCVGWSLSRIENNNNAVRPRLPELRLPGVAAVSVMGVIFIMLLFGTMPAMVRRLYPPLLHTDEDVRPQVVVVLGGGQRLRKGRWRCGVIGLRRLQHGLALAQQHDLPLLLCGGRKLAPAQAPSEAALMAEEVRARDPGQRVWLEESSRTTWENAVASAEVLATHGVQRILLVTDRPHMTRALLCFRAQDLEVALAPLDRLPSSGWVPTAAALALVPEIWYEWLALLWYGLRWR